MLRLVVVASLLTGCLVEPTTSPYECFDDEDCASGEQCSDHLCYGNPPQGQFAALILPRADSSEQMVAPVEIPLDFDEANYGRFDATIAPLVKLSGRVVLGDAPERSVAAQLTLRRPSRFPGGDGFLVNFRSVAGMGPDTPSFTAWVQATEPGESYELTIVPDDTGAVDNPTELAPPYRQKNFTFVEDTAGLVFPLGGGPASVKQIVGRVLDADGSGVEGLAVSAYGYFGPLDPLDLASSRGRTGKDGSFRVKVPVAWEDDFELRFAPPSGASKPEIILREVAVPDPDEQLPDVVHDVGAITLPPMPPVETYTLHVEGQTPEGGTTAPAGAQVVLTTTFVDQGPLTIRYRTSAFVDGEGNTEVPLVPGSAGAPLAYRVDVLPLADAAQAARLGEVIQVGEPHDGDTLTLASPLPLRVSLSGAILDMNGKPQNGVTVRVVPSPRFLFDLAAAERGVDLSALKFPSALTDDTGHFAMWVEGDLLDVNAGYTVLIEPGESSLLPRWVIEDLVIAPDVSGGQSIGEQWLPDAALVRGAVHAADQEPVPGATVKVYEIVDDDLCAVSSSAPAEVDCPPRSILRAQAVSADDGSLRLVLPRP